MRPRAGQSIKMARRMPKLRGKIMNHFKGERDASPERQGGTYGSAPPERGHDASATPPKNI